MMTLMASLVLTGTALVQAQPLPRCANPTQRRFQCANRIKGERQRIAQGRAIPNDQRQALVASPMPRRPPAAARGTATLARLHSSSPSGRRTE